MGKAQHSYPAILVWDLFVRLFHWSLLAAITVAGLTGFVLGATWLDIHIWAGAAAAALIVARLVWGLTGPAFARFSGFLTTPGKTLEHLTLLRAGAAPRHLGHNPLGGWMIVALMALILLLAISGTFWLGGVFKAGPLAFYVDYALGRTTGNLHEVFANLLLGLIAAHVAGALFESWRTAENLPRAMVTGTKERRPGDHLPKARRSRPLLSALTIAVLGGGLAWAGISLARLPAKGLPVADLAPVYAAECSACHMAYPPSLLKAESWHLLMAGLPDHFGEDASLDGATTRAITDWLVANSAETADTKPAHLLSAITPADPFTITKTRAWTRLHADIPEARFAAKPVYSRSNCAACHGDAASGFFYPPEISIPKETAK